MYRPAGGFTYRSRAARGRLWRKHPLSERPETRAWGGLPRGPTLMGDTVETPLVVVDDEVEESRCVLCDWDAAPCVLKDADGKAAKDVWVRELGLARVVGTAGRLQAGGDGAVRRRPDG